MKDGLRGFLVREGLRVVPLVSGGGRAGGQCGACTDRDVSVRCSRRCVKVYGIGCWSCPCTCLQDLDKAGVSLRAESVAARLEADRGLCRALAGMRQQRPRRRRDVLLLLGPAVLGKRQQCTRVRRWTTQCRASGWRPSPGCMRRWTQRHPRAGARPTLWPVLNPPRLAPPHPRASIWPTPWLALVSPQG